jgi:tetratricopeptide (TPR) repeat protein
MRKMKRLLIILIFLPICFLVKGQENQFDILINEGIAYHDNGEFVKAIEKYNEAIGIQPNSSLANYEISYSYLSLQDYENAIKYSKKVVDSKNGHELHSYIVYGTALDMLGKTKKSIKIYEEALKDYDHYLLHYNHAISCFNTGELDNAYESALNAILNNSSHASSHLLLSNIMEKQGSRIKTVLPLYFFLLIEPNSARSNSVYELLISKLDYGVEKTSEKNIDVSIPFSTSQDSDFGAAEMMISLTKASNFSEENANKTEMELFADNNESIFSVLGELKKKKSKGFWWEFYVPFFYDIVQNDHTKAYSYYISQSSGKQEVYDWVELNREELDNFLNWINN